MKYRGVLLVNFLAWGCIFQLCAGENGGEKILNVRDFGAIGDGREHPVREWIQSGRYSSIHALRKAVPAITNDHWSVDEAAFELAKRALPPEGGAVYFPTGTYVATARAWMILRDHLRLIGDGPGKTILTTGTNVLDGLVLAGYRHTGWSRGYPFSSGDGAQGTDVLALREPDAAARFRVGQLVFVRNGANRYDQDYGEVNEVRSVTDDGRVRLTHPLARDYTLDQLNWAGKTVVGCLMPRVDGAVRMAFAQGPDFFLPSRGDVISVGENIFRVESATEPAFVRLVNVGRANAAAGSPIAPGTLVAKERGLVIMAETTRGFRCEKLTVRGRRKALTLSNSFDTAFEDCVIERRPGDGRVDGGIVLDGDDGRYARFVRCEIRANPPCGMQFARSFGSVAFEECHFIDTNVAFTEFNFDCAVTRCSFDIVGGGALKNAIIVGKSCDDIRVAGNTIKARDLATIFDARTDIQSFHRRGRGAVVLRDNIIETSAVGRIFDLESAVAPLVMGNTVSGQYAVLGAEEVESQPSTESVGTHTH